MLCCAALFLGRYISGRFNGVNQALDFFYPDTSPSYRNWPSLVYNHTHYVYPHRAGRKPAFRFH